MKQWNIATLSEQIESTLKEADHWPEGFHLRNLYIHESTFNFSVRLLDSIIEKRLLRNGVYYFLVIPGKRKRDRSFFDRKFFLL